MMKNIERRGWKSLICRLVVSYNNAAKVPTAVEWNYVLCVVVVLMLLTPNNKDPDTDNQ